MSTVFYSKTSVSGYALSAVTQRHRHAPYRVIDLYHLYMVYFLYKLGKFFQQTDRRKGEWYDGQTDDFTAVIACAAGGHDGGRADCRRGGNTE